MSSPRSQDEERVLIVAPTARDAQLSQALFAQAGVHCVVCHDLSTFADELARGAGTVVLTEEALAPQRRQFLTPALAAQPTWSSLPIILLASSGPRQLLSMPLVQELGNVVILDRPISAQTLLSVVDMALRARRRQYQARLVAEASQLLTGSRGDDATMGAVAAMLVPNLADCCLLYTHDGDTARLAALSFARETGPAEARLRDALAGTGPELASGKFSAPGTYTLEALTEGAGAASAVALAEQHLELAGASLSLVVNLEAQGRPLGALGLGLLAPGRALTDDDRQVVREVAGRVALTLEQARLYRAEQAARAEAEAAVRIRDELLALISHDLNNPLAVVLGQAQLLQRQLTGTTSPERLFRRVSAIEGAARRIQAQLRDLLDLARIQAGQALELRCVETDLVALANAVIEGAQQGTGRHTITVQTSLPAVVAQVDPERFTRVLDNLLSNAMKYSPAGGLVAVILTLEAAGHELWAVLTVQDEGIGIPAEDLPYVFERFRRASNVRQEMPGTGLGLASVRQIVEQHGGHIAVESAPDAGTRFIVRLPLSRRE